jgi:hypothetical protein
MEDTQCPTRSQEVPHRLGVAPAAGFCGQARRPGQERPRFQDREFGFWPFAGEYGYFMYAPGILPHDMKDEFDDGDMPESVGRLLTYARHELDCSFVLFDVDGDVLQTRPPYQNGRPT